jgi:hypothetical protein
LLRLCGRAAWWAVLSLNFPYTDPEQTLSSSTATASPARGRVKTFLPAIGAQD